MLVDAKETKTRRAASISRTNFRTHSGPRKFSRQASVSLSNNFYLFIYLFSPSGVVDSHKALLPVFVEYLEGTK